MYQVWHSQDGHLRPGPRFRLLADAVAHVRRQGDEHSFAIRTPDGGWYRDPHSGRMILGRGGKQPSHQRSRRVDTDDEPTQPFGTVPVRSSAAAPRVAATDGYNEDEVTDVSWPPGPGADHVGFSAFEPDATPI